MAQLGQIVAGWPYVQTVWTRLSSKDNSAVYTTVDMKLQHKIFQCKMRLHWYNYMTYIKKYMFYEFFQLFSFSFIGYLTSDEKSGDMNKRDLEINNNEVR
jgi:hypothetical protein